MLRKYHISFISFTPFIHLFLLKSSEISTFHWIAFLKFYEEKALWQIRSKKNRKKSYILYFMLENHQINKTFRFFVSFSLGFRKGLKFERSECRISKRERDLKKKKRVPESLSKCVLCFLSFWFVGLFLCSEISRSKWLPPIINSSTDRRGAETLCEIIALKWTVQNKVERMRFRNLNWWFFQFIVLEFRISINLPLSIL